MLKAPRSLNPGQSSLTGKDEILSPLSLLLFSNQTDNYSFLVNFLEKAMATHSSTLAWKIPWTEEPGGLQSMGPLRVGLD